MENYFNYFTEIEEHFWKKRGTAILLNTLDWALIDSWKQANVPVEAVLRGIDRAFEKQGKRRPGTRRVNSLAYCHRAILEAAQEIEKGQLPHESAPPPFPQEALQAYIGKNAAAVETYASQLAGQGSGESASEMQGIANSLRELAPKAGAGDLQTVEQMMSVLEEKMLGTLRRTCPDAVQLEIRAERDRQMAPYRSRMSAEETRRLEAQFEMRRLLEHAGLPRLSLFYL